MSVNSGAARENHITPPTGGGGAPFAAGSAVNGASLDAGGRVVLGQAVNAVADPGRLLSDREIPMNGFSFSMVGNVGADPLLLLNDSGIGATLAAIGDINGALGNNGLLNISFGQAITMLSAGTNYVGLLLDTALRLSRLGDVGAWGNGMEINIDDLNRSIRVGDVFSPAGTHTLIAIDDGVQNINFQNNSQSHLVADMLNRFYQFGDIAPAGNNNFLQIDDLVEVTQLGQPNLDPGLIIDLQQRQYSIGDLTPHGNGLQLLIDDNSGFVAIGDPGAAASGLQLRVDLGSNRVVMSNNALTAAVRINNVDGFSGTVANPVTITVNGGIVTNVA